MATGTGHHRQLVNMGKPIPVGAHHHMPDRLVVQIGHENVTVLATAIAGKFIRVDAVAFAVWRDQIQRPVLDLFMTIGTGIGAHFKAEIVAPHIRGKTFVSQTYRDLRVFGVHNQVHEKSFFPVVNAGNGLLHSPSQTSQRLQGLPLRIEKLSPERRTTRRFGNSFKPCGMLSQVAFTCTNNPARLAVGRQAANFAGLIARTFA